MAQGGYVPIYSTCKGQEIPINVVSYLDKKEVAYQYHQIITTNLLEFGIIMVQSRSMGRIIPIANLKSLHT